MKKALAILGVLAVVAGAAGGGYALGTKSGGSEEAPSRLLITQPTQEAEEEFVPNYAEMLPGLWQNGPSVGSGIGECYRIYADGTFTFTPSEFVFDPEDYIPPSARGIYKIEDDYVVLLMQKRTVIEGGTWVEDEIMGYVLEGATSMEETLPVPKELSAQYLGVFYDMPREMFSIAGRTYWKISDDPDAYLD